MDRVAKGNKSRQFSERMWSNILRVRSVKMVAIRHKEMGDFRLFCGWLSSRRQACVFWRVTAKKQNNSGGKFSQEQTLEIKQLFYCLNWPSVACLSKRISWEMQFRIHVDKVKDLKTGSSHGGKTLPIWFREIIYCCSSSLFICYNKAPYEWS